MIIGLELREGGYGMVAKGDADILLYILFVFFLVCSSPLINIVIFVCERQSEEEVVR